MAENVILGFPSVEQFRDKDLIHRSLRRTIINAFPNGGAPLTALIAWANVDPIANTKHEWLEEIYRSPSITTRGTNPITTNAPTTGDANDGTVITAKTYTTADKLYIKATSVGLLTVGDVVRFHTWNALARITAVTPGVADNTVNGYVEVLPIRDFTVASGNLADYAAGTSIDVIGSAFEEGGHSGTPRGTRIPTFLQNQTQIFKEPFVFTGSAIKQDLEFDQSGPYKKRAMDAARDHYVKLEKSLLFSKRSNRTVTNADGSVTETRTMSGILEFLEAWDAGSTGITVNGQVWNPYNFKKPSTTDDDPEKRIIENASGEFNIDLLEKWLSNINLYYNAKTAERLVLCGSDVMRAMSKAMRAQGSYHWEVGQKAFGLEFNKLVTAFGTLIFVTHPLFNENPIYRKSALIVDIWSINWRPLRDRDTQVRTNIQSNDFDGRKDEWLSEGTLEFWKPMNHMFIKNMSVFNPELEVD